MNTISRRLLTSALAVLTLAAMLVPARSAHAQVAPINDYRVTWTTCTNVDNEPEEESVAGTFMYTVPSTGETFEVALLMVHTPERTYLSADYYTASGALVATLEIVDDESSHRLTEHSRRLSPAASLSFVEVLQTAEFQQQVLDNCLERKCRPWVKKLLKGLCIAAAAVCCVAASTFCPACAAGGAACGAAVDGVCN